MQLYGEEFLNSMACVCSPNGNGVISRKSGILGRGVGVYRVSFLGLAGPVRWTMPPGVPFVPFGGAGSQTR